MTWQVLTVLGIAAAVGCSLDGRSVRYTGSGGSGGSAGAQQEGAQAGDSTGEKPDCRAGGEGGGGGELPPALCQGTPLADPLLTDFDDAQLIIDDECNPGVGFEVQDVPSGGQSFIYKLFGLTAPAVSLAERDGGLALRVVADPGTPIPALAPLVGFGLGWTGCIDATGYRGLSFVIEGDVGTCLLSVGVGSSQNVDVNLNAGAFCELGSRCYSPQSGVLDTSAGTVRVPFEQMVDGSPVPDVDASTILTINWQLLVPLEGERCKADFIIDDVAFYR